MESRLGMPSRTLLLEAGTDGGKKKPIQEYAGIDQSLANASQLGKTLGTKLVRALVELLFNDPGGHQDPNGPVAEQLASDPMLRESGFERQGTVTTPDGPAVYMVQTRQAFERTRSVA